MQISNVSKGILIDINVRKMDLRWLNRVGLLIFLHHLCAEWSVVRYTFCMKKKKTKSNGINRSNLMKKQPSKSIKDYLKSFFYGMGRSLVIYPQQDYIIPKRGDFKKDAAALRGDMGAVFRGLQKTLDEDGKINSY